MPYEIRKIEEALVNAFKSLDLDSQETDDAMFHMTDWLSDLDEWNKFCEKPDSLTPEELSELVMGFLVHVPAHVAAASKIVTGLPVTDVFGIGATSEEKA
ncbi:MAG: hypothetical protein WBN96_06755 [Gammaproteobacteria bacterium]